MVGVSGDGSAVVAEGDEQGDDFWGRVVEGGEVEGGVGFVGEVGIGEGEGWVRAEDAGAEGGVR